LNAEIWQILKFAKSFFCQKSSHEVVISLAKFLPAEAYLPAGGAYAGATLAHLYHGRPQRHRQL